MKPISSIIPHLSRVMWASSLVVTDVFSVCQAKPSYPKVFLFCPEWEGFYVPQTSIWSDHGCMGLFEAHEADQEVLKTPQISSFVISGRLPHCCPSEISLFSPHLLDSRPPGVVRILDQRREIGARAQTDHCVFRGSYQPSGHDSVPSSRACLQCLKPKRECDSLNTSDSASESL